VRARERRRRRSSIASIKIAKLSSNSNLFQNIKGGKLNKERKIKLKQNKRNYYFFGKKIKEIIAIA